MRFTPSAVKIFHNTVGVSGRFRKEPSEDLRVLVYHDLDFGLEKQFYGHLKEVQKNWRFIGPDEFVDSYSGDDSIGTQVLPQLGICATYFVIPGFVESSMKGMSQRFIAERLFPGELVPDDVVKNLSMSWNQIRELRSFGHEIGSHTMTHPRLSELLDSEIVKEFVDSKTKIADETGRAPRQLAITFGDIRSISKRVLVLAYEHYEVVHTSIRGSNRDRGPLRTVCRETVHPWDTKQFVLATLKGTLDIQYRKSRSIMDSWTEKN
jgi:hypothetical protein